MNSSVTDVLLEGALRALMIALVLWAGMRLFRVSNALVQKAAWTMVLGAAVAMPFIVHWQLRPSWAAVSLPTGNWSKWLVFEHRVQMSAVASPVSSIRVANPVATAAPQDDEETSIAVGAYTQFADDANTTGAASVATAIPSEPTKAAAPPMQRSARIINSAWDWAWLLYLGVGAALLLRVIFGLGSSLRLWAEARRIERGTNLEVPDGIEVRWSRKVGSPVNIGSGILLPDDYAEWDTEKLRVVLAHESAHVQQRDFYLQMLAGLYAAVIWFSPLGWWLKRKLSELSEAISDRAGLEAAGSPVAYAELLLEFAARPRPTFAGVAMAHSTNLHQRIERLLNESSFRRVFAGNRHSAAALVIPAVLIAATALVHVQAAAIPSQSSFTQSVSSSQPAAPSSAIRTGQSHPDQSTDVEAAPATEAEAQKSSATPTPSPKPVPVPSPSSAPATRIHVEATLPPMAPLVNLSPRVMVLAPLIKNSLMVNLRALPAMAVINPIQLVMPTPEEASQDGHHDTYRVFGNEENGFRFNGDLSADCEAAAGKTRQSLQGQVLFVCHDGKPYIIDDPATIAQINDLDKAMKDKSEQMKELGKQVRDQSQQVREEARKEREAAQKLPKPDITKEIAELDAAAASLKADQDGNISREQLQELQRKLSEVQRRLISVEVRVDVNTSVAMGKFSADEGKFGEQMGKLGSEMGQLAHERDQKIRAIIDDSLKNGKAKPVN